MAATFQNENIAAGLPANGQFQSGVSNFDAAGQAVERNVNIPFATDAQANWVYYDVSIYCYLDSGIVVHNHLPQYDSDPDTLASCFISDPNIDRITGRGVNLISEDTYEDVVQRMAHSRYWFCLMGQAMRVGQQVPIPGIKTIAGVPAIPFDETPQIAYNRIVGNYSGYPLYHAVWKLWYTTAKPPKQQQPAPPNPGLFISGTTPLPKGMQAPFSQPDDEAESVQPPLQNPIRARGQ